MNGFLRRLSARHPLILDGGLGTMLIARGLPAGAPPDLWTLERPEVLGAVHRAYVEAGSEAIHANTFGANPIRLARYGLASRCGEINRAAVRLARAAGPAFVLADVGPTGEHLPPVGDGRIDNWREAFREQAQSLAEEPIDAFHVETMTDLREALLALEVLREAAPKIPVLVSLTFDRKKRGFFTLMGDPFAAALLALLDAGASAVGANCTLLSQDMAVLAREARGAGIPPLILQPNAGQPEILGAQVHYRQSPEDFATDMALLARGGLAAAVGGCCGTDPRFITALRLRLIEEAGHAG